ncbi:MAG: glucose-1-phosphate adenylyltransferase, partial [Myxococcota bacterium]
AGGKGSRLGPLTCHRSKPAVPFVGRYRIIDFVLSNFVNSDYRCIYVLTQYMASSLIKHLNRNWRLGGFGEYIEVVPAQMRMGEFWYRGTADAVYQNLNLLRDARAEHAAVFGGDHIYKFDITQMEEAHRDRDAALTVAAFPVPRDEAHQFGVIHIDENQRIVDFVEKPADPPSIPGRPDWSLVSMGNYFFHAETLQDVLVSDSRDENSSHDFGRDIIPRLVQGGAAVYIYDFGTNQIAGEPENDKPYWRDVGTIDSYFQANMDLRSRLPLLNAYNRSWPISTAQRNHPPARFVMSGDGARGVFIEDSLVCEGSIVSSTELRNVLIGYDCFVHNNSVLEESVILSGCDIGSGARLNKVLLDKNCKVEPGATIGYDPKADQLRFPFITEAGIVTLPKGTYVPVDGPIQLAYDIEFLLRNDPKMRTALDQFEGEYTVSDRDRHSYDSAGPRYRRFQPSDGSEIGDDGA